MKNTEQLEDCRKKVHDMMYMDYTPLSRKIQSKFGNTISLYLINMMNWESLLVNGKIIKMGQRFYMTQEKMSDKSCLSIDQQKTSLKKLVDMEIISVDRIPSADGGRRNNYLIRYEKLYNILNEPLPSSPEEDIKTKTAATKSNVGVKPTHPRECKTHSCIIDTKRKRLEILTRTSKDVLYQDAPGVEHPNGILYPEVMTMPLGVRKVVDHWNNIPDLPHLRLPNGKPPTKVYKQTLDTISKVLSGKFEYFPSDCNRSYSADEICSAIDNFYVSIKVGGIIPKWAKSFFLCDFFYNPFGKIQNHFLHHMPMENSNQTLANLLKKAYVERVLGGAPGSFSIRENNQFVRASTYLLRVIKKLSGKVFPPMAPENWASDTIACLRSTFPDQDIKIGNIASEWTYREALPKYLRETARLGDEEKLNW